MSIQIDKLDPKVLLITTACFGALPPDMELLRPGRVFRDTGILAKN